MKSQRRHELHHNTLADWLGKQMEVVKPYTNIILGCVIAVCAVAIIVQVVSWRSTTGQVEAWQKFYAALSIPGAEERLAKLSELENTSAAPWALLTAADLQLEQATERSYSDREKAKKSLDAAEKQYLKVVETAQRQPLLQQRAQLGLAQVYETAGKFDDAKKYYSKLIKEAPDSVFGKAASRRLKRLDSTNLKDFYDQLAAHKPSMKSSSSGLQNLPPGLRGMPGMQGFGERGGFGGMPDFNEPLPDRPDLSLPGPSLDFGSLDPPDSLDPPRAVTPKPKDSSPKPEEDAPPEPDKKPEAEKPADPEKKPDKPEGESEP